MTKPKLPTQPKIWCLFSVDNLYDQPEHNLAGWWLEKPSIECLAKLRNITLGKDYHESLNVLKLWAGEPVHFETPGTRYQLVEVVEGPLE